VFEDNLVLDSPSDLLDKFCDSQDLLFSFLKVNVEALLRKLLDPRIDGKFIIYSLFILIFYKNLEHLYK